MNNELKVQKSIFIDLLLAVISGLLSSIAFPPADISCLAWIALVPWLISLSWQSPGRVCLCSWIMGLTFFSLGLSWLSNVHIFCLAAVLIILPIFYIIFGLIVSSLVHYFDFFLILTVPPIGVGLDYLLSFFLTGFPWLFFGYTQVSNVKLIQIADITGVYGVTFLILLVNALLAEIIILALTKKWMTKKNFTCLGLQISLTVLIILASWFYGHHRLSNLNFALGPKLASIQGNIPQDLKEIESLDRDTILEPHFDLSIQAANTIPKPAMIIWPETMLPDTLLADPGQWGMIHDLALKTGCYLLIGTNHLKRDFDKDQIQFYNSGYFLSPLGNILGRYDKIHLVPVGEYIPDNIPFVQPIVQRMVGYISDIIPGKEEKMFTLNGYSFGVLICFEIIFPNQVRETVGQGCDFIINITNEGWFGNSAEMEQMLAISIMRAVENRVGILRSANTGITAFIPPTGILKPENILLADIQSVWPDLTDYQKKGWKNHKRILWRNILRPFSSKGSLIVPLEKDWDTEINGKRLKWKNIPGFLIQNVPLRAGLSLYTIYGDIFAKVMISISFGFIFLLVVKYFRLRSSSV